MSLKAFIESDLRRIYRGTHWDGSFWLNPAYPERREQMMKLRDEEIRRAEERARKYGVYPAMVKPVIFDPYDLPMKRMTRAGGQGRKQRTTKPVVVGSTPGMDTSATDPAAASDTGDGTTEANRVNLTPARGALRDGPVSANGQVEAGSTVIVVSRR